MTTQPTSAAPIAGYSPHRPSWRTPGFWKENYEFVLAAITLVALLAGWIGGEVIGTMPHWAVITCAIIAFVGRRLCGRDGRMGAGAPGPLRH